MKYQNVHRIVVVLSIFAYLFAANAAFAGTGAGLGTGLNASKETSGIVGPEVRAVVVVNCSGNGEKLTTLRAKRIVNFNVETEALTFFVPFCPTSESDILNSHLLDLTIFEQANPIVTEVTNFKLDLNRNVCSFDAQIEFVK